MLTTSKATWVKVEARNFTNDHGEVVDYWRATFLDDQMEPFTLGCTREVYDFASIELQPLTPVELTVELRRNDRGFRARIVDAAIS